MSTPIETVRAFYTAFAARDHAAMAECYHPAVRFSDPVFTDLQGTEVHAMWHMLCEQGRDLEVSLEAVGADAARAHARWEARYTFTPTGRPVHNVITATFDFEDGRVVRHIDDFSLWRWTRMALGLPGLLTGWTGYTQAKVRATAGAGLTRFIAEHPEYT